MDFWLNIKHLIAFLLVQKKLWIRRKYYSVWTFRNKNFSIKNPIQISIDWCRKEHYYFKGLWIWMRKKNDEAWMRKYCVPLTSVLELSVWKSYSFFCYFFFLSNKMQPNWFIRLFKMWSISCFAMNFGLFCVYGLNFDLIFFLPNFFFVWIYRNQTDFELMWSCGNEWRWL